MDATQPLFRFAFLREEVGRGFTPRKKLNLVSNKGAFEYITVKEKLGRATLN